MKITFYTIDLYKGREHLMPWRTVLEVALRLQYAGHDVCILNGRNDYSISESNEIIDWCELNIKTISLGYKALADMVNSLQPDVLYIQTTWRDGLKDFTPLKAISSKKIVYFSGGIYDISSACILARRWGTKVAKPYLLESLVPKFLLAKKMKNAGITTAIGLTPYTTTCCKMAGFAKSVCVQTGKDEFEYIIADESILDKYNLRGKKWMLFSGSPAPTRGACELLKSIDKTKDISLRVVMLMRTDVNSEYRDFLEIYNGMIHKEKARSFTS